MTTHRTALSSILRAGAWFLPCVFSACIGAIGDGGAGLGGSGGGASGTSSGGSSSGGAGDSGGAGLQDGQSAVDAFPCTSTAPSSGPTPLLLLSRAQYLNTLQGMFG